jgi:hypothetical protein
MRKTDRDLAPKSDIRLYPTLDVIKTFGRGRKAMRPILETALDEIRRAGKGLDIHHHRFRYNGRALALASSYSPERERLAIEVDLCPARLPEVTLCAEEARAQREAAFRRARDSRSMRRTR